MSRARGALPQKSRLRFRLSSTASAPVNLAGWTIESAASGNASTIPEGTEVPLSGTIQAVQDITLKPGDTAIIVSGSSPIGASFRENKCIGYFSTYQKFSPALPLTCPTPSTELLANYPDYLRDVACINYVNKLSRCSAQLTPPTTVSGACQTFLTTYLNYNGCVQEHRTDADFEGNTWRIYLGRSSSMWRPQHEEVKLLDASGKTVDAFTY